MPQVVRNDIHKNMVAHNDIYTFEISNSSNKLHQTEIDLLETR